LIGRKKNEKLVFLRGNFPNPEVADPTPATKNDTTQPGSKLFDLDPSLNIIPNLRCKL